MGGEPDAPLGEVEAKLVAHRPAQPGVHARVRRPNAFDESTDNDAIKAHKAGFERAINAHAMARTRTAHDAIGDGGQEQLSVIGRRNAKIRGCRLLRDVLQRRGERRPIGAG